MTFSINSKIFTCNPFICSLLKLSFSSSFFLRREIFEFALMTLYQFLLISWDRVVTLVLCN